MNIYANAKLQSNSCSNKLLLPKKEVWRQEEQIEKLSELTKGGAPPIFFGRHLDNMKKLYSRV